MRMNVFSELLKVYQIVCQSLFSISTHPIPMTIFGETIFELYLHSEVQKIEIETLD